MTNTTGAAEPRWPAGTTTLLMPPPTFTADRDQLHVTISLPNTDQSWAAARLLSSMGSLALPSTTVAKGEASTKDSTQLSRSATPVADSLVQPEQTLKRNAARSASARKTAGTPAKTGRTSGRKAAGPVEASTNERVAEAA